MSAHSDWVEANNAFLSSALAELRSRLTALADEQRRHDPVVPAMPAAPMPEPHGRRGFGGRRRSEEPAAAADVLRLEPAPRTAATDPPAAPGPTAAPAADGVATAPAVVPDEPALRTLAERLGLTDFERDVVLLCASVEFDTRFAGLMADALEPQHRYPTFALALAALSDPSWDAISPEGPLRYWGIVDVEPGGPVISSRLSIDERILHYLKGLTYLDGELASLLTTVPPVPMELVPPSHTAIVDGILEALRERQGKAVPVIQLLGSGGDGKRAVAQAVSARFGAPLMELAADGFPPDDSRAEALTRLIRRETALNPFALFIDVQDVERRAPQVAPLARWLGRTDQLVFLDAAEPWPAIDGAVFDVGRPTPAEQHSAWSEQLAPDVAGAAGRLAGQFDFPLPTIHRIAARATARAAEAAAPVEESTAGGGCDGASLAGLPVAGAPGHGPARPADRPARPVERHPASRRRTGAAARDRGAGRAAQHRLRRLRVSRQAQPRAGHQRAVRRSERHRQDAGRRGARERARAAALPDRPVGGGQQVHRRDREEPAPALRRGGRRRRDPVLRRGRRPVRQTQRGQRQPRPLRQHRGELPAAAHGVLSRPGDSGDESEERARHGFRPSSALHRGLSVPRGVRAQEDLAERLPSGARPSGGSTSIGSPVSTSPAAASATSP